jgi:16S rRNA (cytosine967-C5)-methyltransferase
VTNEKEGKSLNIRELVLGILIEVLENNQYSSGVIHNTLVKYQYLEKQDRAFLSRLSEGTIERKIELDYILNQVSKVKVNKMKPVIRNILRMGVYQVKYMEQVPDSAACNEAVKLAKKKGFHNLTGFVNGVLRNTSRNILEMTYPSEEKEPVKYLSVTSSTPGWIIEMWLKSYDYITVKRILLASLEDKKTTIRCNLNKTTVVDLKEKIQQDEVEVVNGSYLPYAIKISNYNYINKIPGFLDGAFQVQDESSMLVAEAAGIEENNFIIDVCAAPGGKSLHGGEKLGDTGKVSARDISEYKISLIDENIKRSGLKNIHTKIWDALELDKESIGKADVVFADLPCSGLGVIGKKSDIKYKITMENCEELARLQRDILSVVQQYVKTGGVLIYSTCTINDKENLDNAHWFEKEFDFHMESMDEFLPVLLQQSTTKKGYLQMLPGIHKTDGFFLAKFRKEGEEKIGNKR